MREKDKLICARRRKAFSFGYVGKQLYKEEEACFYAELPYGLQNSFLWPVYSILTAVEVSATADCYTSVHSHAIQDTLMNRILPQPEEQLLLKILYF